jgi:hypothetical protein
MLAIDQSGLDNFQDNADVAELPADRKLRLWEPISERSAAEIQP